MPACMSPFSAASVLHEGPIVQIIFARRAEVSGGHRDGLSGELSVMG